MAPAQVVSMSLDMDEDEKLFSEEAICLSESFRDEPALQSASSLNTCMLI